jgi:flavin reductase (DIM6/NTAB) family NADH-FMN oxidoreductase RutF
LEQPPEELVTLDTGEPVWDRVFTVAPLVVIGTREGDGYDLAPKHMATPLGWSNYFGFVCSPRHATYHNAKEHGGFTVSFVRAREAVAASLTASPRCDDDDGERPSLDLLSTFPAERIDGVLLREAYLFLECELDRVVDDFGENSLVAGRVVAARVHRAALRTTERSDARVLQDTSPLVYLAPGRYTDTDHSFSFPFPAGFQR